jgi:hypothetical protein
MFSIFIEIDLGKRWCIDFYNNPYQKIRGIFRRNICKVLFIVLFISNIFRKNKISQYPTHFSITIKSGSRIHSITHTIWYMKENIAYILYEYITWYCRVGRAKPAPYYTSSKISITINRKKYVKYLGEIFVGFCF